MDVLLNPSYEYRALTHDLPFIILCRKFVNARYLTTVTSPLPPPYIRLEMMVKNQYKGILKKQYMSLVYNELMGSRSTVNELPRERLAVVH